MVTIASGGNFFLSLHTTGAPYKFLNIPFAGNVITLSKTKTYNYDSDNMIQIRCEKKLLVYRQTNKQTKNVASFLER